MSIFWQEKDWENVAAAACSALIKPADAAEWARILKQFREEFRRVAQEVRAKANAEREERRAAYEAKKKVIALQHDHVVFDPWYRIGDRAKHYPRDMKVHQRRPGKTETLCGVNFEPNIEHDKAETISSNPKGWLRKCRVCKALGGLQERQERVMFVRKRKRAPRV